MSGGRLLVLASASTARARLLESAGLSFVCDPAAIDEDVIKRAVKERGLSLGAAAAGLAEAKARHVAGRHPGALIIGADQILECEGRWFDKARSLSEAVETFVALRGRTHRLATAAAVVRDTVVLFSTVETPRLTMRPFTDKFLRNYMEEIGSAALETVGGYRLEGYGVQLFSRINGSYFAILGLPMLSLLEFLRVEGVIER